MDRFPHSPSPNCLLGMWRSDLHGTFWYPSNSMRALCVSQSLDIFIPYLPRDFQSPCLLLPTRRKLHPLHARYMCTLLQNSEVVRPFCTLSNFSSGLAHLCIHTCRSLKLPLPSTRMDVSYHTASDHSSLCIFQRST